MGWTPADEFTDGTRLLRRSLQTLIIIEDPTHTGERRLLSRKETTCSYWYNSPTVGDTRQHTSWADFQSSITPHKVRFQYQTTLVQKAAGLIFPTTPTGKSSPAKQEEAALTLYKGRSN